MTSQAASIDEYIEGLATDRQEAIQAIRSAILQNLDPVFKEGIQYGMIGYAVPHEVYPKGYHCDPKQPLYFAGLASQKSHIALYLMCVYMDPELEAFVREAFAQAGKKLDMGKSCIRFKKLEDVPLEVIGEVIRRMPAQKFIDRYEAILATSKSRSRSKGS
jgi:uncharacterized protein YdhG (YjbR/CyaY superfamily)